MLILYPIFKKLGPICWEGHKLVQNVKKNVVMQGGVGREGQRGSQGPTNLNFGTSEPPLS